MQVIAINRPVKYKNTITWTNDIYIIGEKRPLVTAVSDRMAQKIIYDPKKVWNW